MCQSPGCLSQGRGMAIFTWIYDHCMQIHGHIHVDTQVLKQIIPFIILFKPGSAQLLEITLFWRSDTQGALLHWVWYPEEHLFLEVWDSTILFKTFPWKIWELAATFLSYSDNHSQGGHVSACILCIKTIKLPQGNHHWLGSFTVGPSVFVCIWTVLTRK
jgi:hypothetical protein